MNYKELLSNLIPSQTKQKVWFYDGNKNVLYPSIPHFIDYLNTKGCFYDRDYAVLSSTRNCLSIVSKDLF